jgi:hypothetical protein
LKNTNYKVFHYSSFFRFWFPGLWLYSPVCGYHCFTGTFCFHLQGMKMEVAGYCKTSVTTRGILSSQEHNLNFHCCENLRSRYSVFSCYFLPPWSALCYWKPFRPCSYLMVRSQVLYPCTVKLPFKVSLGSNGFED